MGYGAVAPSAADAADSYMYSPPVSHECEYLEISPGAHTPDELLRSHGEVGRASVVRRVGAAAVVCAAVAGVAALSGGRVESLASIVSGSSTAMAALQTAASYVTYESSSTCTTNCGGDDLAFPHEVYSVNGHLEYTLEVNTFRYEGPVSLNMRSFDGKVAGPTMVASPGDKVTIHLKNSLEQTSADSPVAETQSLWAAGDLDTTSCEALGETNMTSLYFQVRERPSRAR